MSFSARFGRADVGKEMLVVNDALTAKPGIRKNTRRSATALETARKRALVAWLAGLRGQSGTFETILFRLCERGWTRGQVESAVNDLEGEGAVRIANDGDGRIHVALVATEHTP